MVFTLSAPSSDGDAGASVPAAGAMVHAGDGIGVSEWGLLLRRELEDDDEGDTGTMMEWPMPPGGVPGMERLLPERGVSGMERSLSELYV